MSTSPDEQESTHHYGDAAASETEAVAKELLTLVDEFEAEISGAHVPPAFTERLAELRQIAERLIDQQARGRRPTHSRS